jgi:hypothetical protein
MHTLQVFYKPDQYPSWVMWREFSQKFDLIGKAGAIDAGGIPSARPGFAPRIPLGKPQNDIDPTTGRLLRRAYDFQVKFKGTGHVVIDKFRLHAQKIVEKSTSKC